MMWHLGELGARQEHVDRHAGGEVVDDHLEFCKARSWLGSDGRKAIEHATMVKDQLRNHTGDWLDLLSTKRETINMERERSRPTCQPQGRNGVEC